MIEKGNIEMNFSAKRALSLCLWNLCFLLVILLGLVLVTVSLEGLYCALFRGGVSVSSEYSPQPPRERRKAPLKYVELGTEHVGAARDDAAVRCDRR